MDQLKATPYDRTEVRQRYSNGHRPRTLTRGGQVVLAMPRTRDGSFSADLFFRYRRSEQALGPALTYVAATGSGWSCSASGQIVTCTSAGPIAPNQDTTILLKVRVAAQAGTQITNCATVETEDDANPANNRGCHTGTVQR